MTDRYRKMADDAVQRAGEEAVRKMF